MSRREITLFILLGGLLIGAGFWYYLRLQNIVAPDNTPEVIVTNQTSTEIPELDSEIVQDGLSNAWDISFLPDKTVLFTERAGVMSKIENGKKVILHTIANIKAIGEGGLMGLTVDPDFAQNRFVYACYNTAEDIRISRWKIDDKVTQLSEQMDIVTGMPANTTTFPGRHSGCRIQFGQDKNLWVGTGDVAIGTNPQDPKNLGGKILRVNRDGAAVDDNLAPPFDPRIFSYGHRNTQGLALFDVPKDDVYGFSIEHGSDKDDEINLLVSGNFGWNPVPGYNERVSMTDKQKYPEAIEAVWSSGDPTIAPSGAAIIKGSKWKAFENRLAVAVLKDKHIRLFELDASGKKILSERQLLVNEYGRIRSVVMGPDEGLYVTTDNGNNQDQIIKITPR